MTNNFKPNKGGYRQPQLSTEEWKAKKQAEKDAVYQMIDDAATAIVQDGESSEAFLIHRQGSTAIPPQTLCSFITSTQKPPSLKTSVTGRRKRYLSIRVQRVSPFLNPLSTQRRTEHRAFPTMSKRSLMYRRPKADRLRLLPSTVIRKLSLP